MSNEMLTLSEVFKMLTPAMNHGCSFAVYKEKDNFAINLNTGAKSECILKLEGDILKAYRRYDRVDVVENFEDVLDLVFDCSHGRSFFNDSWVDVLMEYGHSDPRGTL